jgi:hypothetical protein
MLHFIQFLIVIYLLNSSKGYEIESSQVFCMRREDDGYELAPAADGDRIELKCGLCR